MTTLSKGIQRFKFFLITTLVGSGLFIAAFNFFQYRAEKKALANAVKVETTLLMIGGHEVKQVFFLPEDFYTLEIDPSGGEFWLIATTPRKPIRLRPGVVHIRMFTAER